MIIFDGKKQAGKILENLKREIKERKIKPNLAIISIEPDFSSKLYVRLKQEAAKKIGVQTIVYRFTKNDKEEKIIRKIKNINSDSSIDGIIVQLPIPKKFNENRIILSIDPRKDVDGFHQKNRMLLKRGDPYFLPVLPSVIFFALKVACIKDIRLSSGETFVERKRKKSKRIVALVNSDIFGNTLKDFFKREGVEINYFIKSKYSASQVKEIIQNADTVISVLGCPRFINRNMIKNGVILIDAGISRCKKKTVGDVDRQSVEGRASFLTPVPGGLGPLTVALLLKNVTLSASYTRNS